MRLISDYMKGLERERADVVLSVDGTSWVRKKGFDDPALEVDSYRCRGVGMAAQGNDAGAMWTVGESFTDVANGVLIRVAA
jgi:hypothetical protein